MLKKGFTRNERQFAGKSKPPLSRHRQSFKIGRQRTKTSISVDRATKITGLLIAHPNNTPFLYCVRRCGDVHVLDQGKCLRQLAGQLYSTWPDLSDVPTRDWLKLLSADLRRRRAAKLAIAFTTRVGKLYGLGKIYVIPVIIFRYCIVLQLRQ